MTLTADLHNLQIHLRLSIRLLKSTIWAATNIFTLFNKNFPNVYYVIGSNLHAYRAH